ncbi:hypothetical protein INR49_025150 [Caranx melampygus]|nr:hypothetical protein INR49_025150 [Caranx melampygus]
MLAIAEMTNGGRGGLERSALPTTQINTQKDLLLQSTKTGSIQWKYNVNLKISERYVLLY